MGWLVPGVAGRAGGGPVIVWMLKTPDGQLCFGSAYKSRESALAQPGSSDRPSVRESVERYGWRLVAVELREVNTPEQSVPAK